MSGKTTGREGEERRRRREGCVGGGGVWWCGGGGVVCTRRPQKRDHRTAKTSLQASTQDRTAAPGPPTVLSSSFLKRSESRHPSHVWTPSAKKGWAQKMTRLTARTSRADLHMASRPVAEITPRKGAQLHRAKSPGRETTDGLHPPIRKKIRALFGTRS